MSDAPREPRADATDEGSPPRTSGPATDDIVEVPPFARSFPDDPELRRLVIAFEQGRYDVVRDGAPRLAESATDPKVARAARELRARLDADPMAVKLLAGAIALLALLTLWAYTHHQP